MFYWNEFDGKQILLHVGVEAPALRDDQVVGLHLLQRLVVLFRRSSRIHLKNNVQFGINVQVFCFIKMFIQNEKALYSRIDGMKLIQSK